ncbi:hypothetical protein PanWU01x14_101470 [Parasponia andersonii]|uniref:Uncharacterized protein n=1 Tax=Parasponia andersonii TaxID=3476 RepID=A0A2P5D362_PARAD|nr:hypothetical protein PanWU01x14_101470 [Parasponia andersonii]
MYSFKVAKAPRERVQTQLLQLNHARDMDNQRLTESNKTFAPQTSKSECWKAQMFESFKVMYSKGIAYFPHPVVKS